jgi:archaellum component FlaG (FlaF/FlaG flagellin family)
MTNRDFDWVKARAECSRQVVFEQLRLGAKHDAATRTEMLLKKNASFGFCVVSHNSSFSVLMQGDISELRSIVFTLTADGISVQDGSGKPIATATLTLNDDGDCRLEVEGKELDFWQFRKMALHDLLFGNPMAESRG